MCKRESARDDVAFSDVIFDTAMTDVGTAPTTSRNGPINHRLAASAPILAQVQLPAGRRRSPTYFARYVAGVRRPSLTSVNSEDIIKNSPRTVSRFELTRYKALPAINSTTSKDDRHHAEISRSFSEEALDQIVPCQGVQSAKSMCDVVIAEDSYSSLRTAPKKFTQPVPDIPSETAKSSAVKQRSRVINESKYSDFLHRDKQDSEWKSLQRRKTFAIIEPLPDLNRPTVQQDDEDVVEYNLD